jgi:uncharacterized protein YgiM (DUF1202 family)
MLRQLIFASITYLAFNLLTAKPLLADTAQVQVTQAFVNVHTGPAIGYPVFHVIERGEWLTVLKRRTNWFKVELSNQKQGWITLQDLNQTLTSIGETTQINDGTFAKFGQRNAELAVFAGSFDSIPAMTLAGTWVWTENLAAELSYTQALGDFSKNELAIIRIQHSMFPEWKVSPYLSLGAGLAITTPRANLVQSGDEKRNSDALEIGLGARYYLNRNFIVRLEYKNLLLITDRDQQEEINQWNIGFAVFF